jgi:HSP20 family protein
VGDVSADYSDGILTLTIPVKEEAKPQKIEVTSHKAKVLEAASS